MCQTADFPSFSVPVNEGEQGTLEKSTSLVWVDKKVPSKKTETSLDGQAPAPADATVLRSGHAQKTPTLPPINMEPDRGVLEEGPPWQVPC